MIESIIMKVLQNAVKAAVAASDIPALPINFLGRVFTIPTDNKYLEIVYIPNNVQNEFWGQGKTYMGVMRLILHWPVEDAGIYTPMRTAESIADGLGKGSRFYDADSGLTVSVNEQPNLLNILQEPTELLIPISVRYHCFKA